VSQKGGEIGHEHAVDALADIVVEAVRVAIAVRGAVLAAEMTGDRRRGVGQERWHGRMR